MKFPILYSFRRCPFAIRARMAIKTANIVCELREVVLNNKPVQMINISNKGTVPVMQLPDGSVIDESIDLMIWALEQSDPEQWLSANKEETQELINENDFEFKEHLDHYKYYVRYPENTQSTYRQQCEKYIDKLDKLLEGNNGLGLLEKRTTLADVAIFPFIRQFANVDRNWFDRSKYTILRQWLEYFENSNLFKSVMDKYSPWENEKEVTLFG